MADDYGKQKAKKFKKGSFTATQTGARKEALLRDAYQQQRQIMNSTEESSAFEDVISGKRIRPTRKKP